MRLFNKLKVACDEEKYHRIDLNEWQKNQLSHFWESNIQYFSLTSNSKFDWDPKNGHPLYMKHLKILWPFKFNILIAFGILFHFKYLIFGEQSKANVCPPWFKHPTDEKWGVSLLEFVSILTGSELNRRFIWNYI